MICRLAPNSCKSTKRELFDLVSEWKANASVNLFQVKAISILEEYAEAKYASTKSCVCSLSPVGKFRYIDRYVILFC